MDLVVATTGRTGSNFLQRLLRNNGTFDPNEWFHQGLHGFGENVESGPMTTEQWLAKMRDEKSVDGAFGVKVMETHLKPMGDHCEEPKSPVDVVPYLLPDAKYLFLYRRDTYRQAISVWRASVTGKYIKIAGRDEKDTAVEDELTFDAARFEQSWNYVARGNQTWENVFATHDLPVHAIAYEDLIEEPKQHLEMAFDLIGKPLPTEPQLETMMLRQADALTDQILDQAVEALGEKLEREYTPSIPKPA